MSSTPNDFVYVFFPSISIDSIPINLQLSESDCVSNICIECHNFIERLQAFDERCLKVNTLFNNLITSTELQLDSDYLQGLRFEAGLDRDVVSGLITICLMFMFIE